MTTPTAVTIFRWLSLSSAPLQPIFENRSEPLQQIRAAMDSQNHMVYISF